MQNSRSFKVAFDLVRCCSGVNQYGSFIFALSIVSLVLQTCKIRKQTTFATTVTKCGSTPSIPLTISLFLLATMYGNGVYFALDASYSARSTYSPPDANGRRYMYLTRVLVGEYTVGRQGLLTPPAKNLSDPTDTFDSVVDKMRNPGIFVVFYDWQCYPEYLITFH